MAGMLKRRCKWTEYRLLGCTEENKNSISFLDNMLHKKMCSTGRLISEPEVLGMVYVLVV